MKTFMPCFILAGVISFPALGGGRHDGVVPPPVYSEGREQTDGPTEPENIVDIKSRKNFDRQLANEKNDIIIVDFWAPWCLPCRKLGQKIKSSIAKSYPEVSFYKVDTDNVGELRDAYHVSSIPALMLMKRDEKGTWRSISRWVGGDVDELERQIGDAKK